MGLIDLKTDLKSLKYGNDTRGGGSSNQPYVTSPIPDGFAPTSPDFLLRNGYLNPVSSLNDVSRLTKWFTDTKSPNGILFTAKQLLLERQNVQIPGGFNRIYNPAGTLAQAGVLSTGYHLNKQGLNPFARGYFNEGEEGYYSTNIPKPDNNNEGSQRLAFLYENKQLFINTNNSNYSKYNISSNPLDILSYSGGPNSVLGIGNTNIRFTGTGKRERTNNKIVLADAEKIYSNFGNVGSILSDDSIKLAPDPQLRFGQATVLNSLNPTYNPEIKNFNREKTYSTGVTEYKPLNRLFNPNESYNDRIDKQNQLPITGSNGSAYNDLIKFYFEIINNDDSTTSFASDFLFFRAYLNNIGDNFKADWQSYKYVGRAENFYKYSGFSRDISLSFTIYAHSRAEMIPIYQKLNYLLGTTAPSYSNIGLMRGNFIRMTVGDYLLDVPGIIQSINLKPSLEAGWDINRKEDGTPFKPEEDNSQEGDEFVGQLPRLIEVDLSFTPIHTFTPQIGENFIRNT